MEENNTLTYEEIVAAWIDKWKPEFVTHAKQKKGFAIPASEFPEDEELIDMILENIGLQFPFSRMYDEEDDCYRFAFDPLLPPIEEEYNLCIIRFCSGMWHHYRHLHPKYCSQ